jgi:peptide deformylase
MTSNIVQYGHPALRQKGARIEVITPVIHKLIDDMLETMQAAHGVGLAAQQIGKALQLAVIDVAAITDRPSTLEVDGKAVAVEPFMPLILINPEIKPAGNPVAGPEGCLSFPEIYAEIARPESVEVITLDREGKEMRFKAGGLLARAIQHEYDHLQGILFIDRMTRDDKTSFKPQLEELQRSTKEALKKDALRM